MIEDVLHDVTLGYLLERESVGASEKAIQSLPSGIDLAGPVKRVNLAFKLVMLPVIFLNDSLELAEVF